MKFVITMKTPDAVDCACAEAATEYNERVDETIMDEDIYSNLTEICERWFKYGESVSIEIDTDKNTATVLESRK